MINEIQEVKFGIEASKRSQDYTLYFQTNRQKQYILSKYTPREDALQMLGSDLGNKQTVWIILGFGFGYMLDELMLKLSDNLQVFIIEPNEELLEEQIAITQKNWLKEKKNIHFFSGEDFEYLREKLKAAIPGEEFNNIKLIYINKYFEFYNKYYKAVVEIIDDVITRETIDRNTIRKYASSFVKNIFENREHIKNTYDLAIYEKQYKNIPGLIVSGGPSLSKNIEFIKDFKGVIFTGSRTLTPILQQGIKPDFLVSIDPTDKIYDTLMGNTQSDIPLITLDKSNAKLIAAHKGRKYFLPSGKAAREILGVNLDVTLDRGGSVATICLSAAHYMGCNPIIFIGQDLAHTDMKLHADICSDDKNGLGNSNIIEDTSLKKQDNKQIKGYNGEQVWSSAVLVTYLRWIEDFIAYFKEVKYINATEGGAFIEGTINQKFKEVVNQYHNSQKSDITELERQCNLDVDIDKNIIQAVEALEKFKKLAEKAKNAASKLKKEYVTYKGNRSNKIQLLLNQMRRIDEEILAIGTVKSIIGDLFNSAYYYINSRKEQKEAIGENELNKGIRIASHNYSIYQALEESAKEVIKIIQQTLEFKV